MIKLMLMGAEFGSRGKPLHRLRDENGLNTRQLNLLRNGQVAPNLRPDWEKAKQFNDRVLGPAEALVAKVDYLPLMFADIPPSLTVDTVYKAHDFRLVAVPAFPLSTSTGIMDTLQHNPTSPIVRMYGEEGLVQMANSNIDVNRSGHWVLMSSRGADAQIWKELGLNGDKDVSLEKVQVNIQANGKFVAEGRGFEGATIGVATFDEIRTHNLLYPRNPIYGITSTRIPGTDKFVVVTEDGLSTTTKDEPGMNVPLVVRLSEPKMAHLPPYIEPKAVEVAEQVAETPDTEVTVPVATTSLSEPASAAKDNAPVVADPVPVFVAPAVVHESTPRTHRSRTDIGNALEEELIDIARDYARGPLRRRTAEAALDDLDDRVIAAAKASKSTT